MPETHEQGGASEQFDVVIVGFEPRDDTPEAGLKRVFGLDDQVANKLVQSLPATVQRGVNRVRAEYFRKALDLIGAMVEVRTPHGEVVPPPGAPGPVPQLAAAPAPFTPHAEEPAATPPFQAPPVVARPPTPLEVELQPHAFGATLAMREAPTPSAASAHVPAPTPESARPETPVVRASANATLKEGVVVAPLLAAAGGQAGSADVGTADTQALPRSNFRFGDTNAPFMRGILGDGPSEQVAPLAAVTPPAEGGLSFNLPMPVALALPMPAAGAASPAPPEPTEADAAGPGAAGWGDIDRGRHSLHRPAMNGGPAVFATPDAPALELDLPPKEKTPVLGIEAPSATGSAPKVVSPLKGISAEAKVSAPDARELAKAIRKQQIQGQASGLGAERPEVPKAAAILREAEQQSKAARRRALAGFSEPDTSQRGTGPAPSNKPPEAAQEPAPSPKAAAPRKPVERPASTRPPQDTRSFWDAIGSSLTFPFRGEGLAWLTTAALYSIAVSGIVYASGPLGVVGTAIAFMARSSLLAFTADLHRRALWRAVESGNELDAGPELSFDTFLRRHLGAGMHLSLFTVLSQAPLLIWAYRTYFPSVGDGANPYLILSSPLFWFLAIGPAFYWPMALATGSVQNDLGATWNVPMGMRALLRAPAQYATIVLLGAWSLLGVWGPFVVVGILADLPQVYFDATLGLGLAFSCTVMGALTGHLARARPTTFQ